jgi:hypothetical protein
MTGGSAMRGRAMTGLVMIDTATCVKKRADVVPHRDEMWRNDRGSMKADGDHLVLQIVRFHSSLSEPVSRLRRLPSRTRRCRRVVVPWSRDLHRRRRRLPLLRSRIQVDLTLHLVTATTHLLRADRAVMHRAARPATATCAMREIFETAEMSETVEVQTRGRPRRPRR